MLAFLHDTQDGPDCKGLLNFLRDIFSDITLQVLNAELFVGTFIHKYMGSPDIGHESQVTTDHTGEDSLEGSSSCTPIASPIFLQPCPPQVPPARMLPVAPNPGPFSSAHHRGSLALPPSAPSWLSVSWRRLLPRPTCAQAVL